MDRVEEINITLHVYTHHIYTTSACKCAILFHRRRNVHNIYYYVALAEEATES